MSNATKYTQPGGTIAVSLTGNDERVTLTVLENGAGMTPDEQRQAYDRFFRADSARSNAIQGIGVGLAIVKDIIDAHHGHITLTSTPKLGTRFEIQLPTKPPRNPT